MIKPFIVYDNETGREKRRGSCPEHMFEIQAQDGEHVIEDPLDPQLPYVVSGTTISGLPVPCTATLDGVDYLIADGVIEMRPDAPGHYFVRVAASNFTPVTIEVISS